MVTVKREKQLGDGPWEMPEAEGTREAEGTQSARIYIEQRQANVAQWVALRPLFEVFTRERRYEGGGEDKEGVVAPRGNGKKLWDTLEDLREAKTSRKIGGEMDM